MPGSHSGAPEHQPEKPVSPRKDADRVLLTVTTAGEVHASPAEIRQKLGRLIPGLESFPNGKTVLDAPIVVPSCRVEIIRPDTRLTDGRLIGDVRFRLEVLMSNGELMGVRVLAAHVPGNVRNFSTTAQKPSDEGRAVVHQMMTSKKRERGPIGKFFHRVGLAIGLESSIRADQVEPELSGHVEGGKHIPTAAELARKFLGTATDQKTPAGFRTRYLQQLMDTVPQESQQCVRAANADGLQALVSALDDVARHPAFSTSLESLSKGGGNEGSSSQSLMGGGSGQSERYKQLKAKYVGLQQTAESRLARMKGGVKTYGPPRQQNRHKASGTLGGWRSKGAKKL